MGITLTSTQQREGNTKINHIYILQLTTYDVHFLHPAYIFMEVHIELKVILNARSEMLFSTLFQLSLADGSALEFFIGISRAGNLREIH